MERNSPYQTQMTWKIPRSSGAENLKYRFSSLKKKNALDTKIWSTVYGIYASFLKSWTIKQPISSANDLKDTSFFKRGIFQISFFKPKKKKKHLTQKYEVQFTGNMPNPESPDGKQPINRNLKLHNVSYQRSLSQTMCAFSCIPFILLTIDMSSSWRIEKFPSSYSSESAEWKVLHKKKSTVSKQPFKKPSQTCKPEQLVMMGVKSNISPRVITKSRFQILIALKSMFSRGASLQFGWQDPNSISQLVYLTNRSSKF